MTQLMVPPTALTMMAALQIGQVPHGRFFTLVTYVHTQCSFECINLYGSQQCSLKVWSNMHPAHTQNIGNIYTLESRIGGCQWMAPFVGWRGSLPSSTTLLYNVLTAAPMSGCLNDVMKVQKKHVNIDFQSRLPSLFLEVSVTVCTNKKN